MTDERNLTVLRPASVMALAHMKSESVKLTLRNGVEDPHSTRAAARIADMK